MTDIARLAIEVDPKQLQAAVQQLEKLSVASGKAEVSAKKLEKAEASAALAIASANRQAANAAVQAAAATTKVGSAQRAAAAEGLKQANSAYQAAKGIDLQAAASLKAAQAALQQSEAAQKLIQSNQSVADSAQSAAAVQDRTMRNMGRLAGQQQANMTNIAAQFQDIGVTAAMGMNPMMIGLQQGAQLTGVWGSVTGTTSERLATFGGAIRSVLSPMSLLIIGMTAGLAALIQFVDWTGLAKSALFALANGLEAFAPYAAAAGAALALAFAPTIIGIIASITSTIVTGLIPALWGTVKAMLALAAANPFVAMILTMAAVVTAAYLLRDELKRVLGFDLVKVIKDVAEFIIDAFGAAFDTVKTLWNNLKSMNLDFSVVDTFMASFGVRQKTSAVDAGIEWGTNFVSGIADKIRSFASGIGVTQDEKTKGAKTAKGRTEPTEAEKFSKLMTEGAANLVELRQEGEMIGMIGTAADYAAARYQLMNKAKEQGINLAIEGRQQQIDDLAFMIAQQKNINATKKFQEEYNQTLARSAEELRIEQAALGMTADAAELYRFEQEMLNAAKLAGITLDERYIQTKLREKEAIIAGTTELNRQRSAMDAAKGAMQGFFSDIKSGLLQGQSLWKTWGNAVLSILDKVIDKIMTDMVSAMLTANQAGGGGGLLGIFSKAFGIVGGGGLDQTIRPVENVPTYKFAKGGAFTNSVVHKPTSFFAKGGTPGVMGEAGPEAIMPLQRGPDGSLGVQMYGGGTNPEPTVVQVVPSEYFDVVVDQRAAKVAAPMVVQGALVSNKVSENTSARRSRRRLS